jgi:hypothetical protein
LQKLLGVSDEAKVAEYDLRSNPHLLITLYDNIAQATDEFDTLDQYQKRFQTRLNPPSEPDPNDKKIAPFRKLKSETTGERQREKTAWQQYHYLKAKKQYETDLQTFSEKAERHRRIVSTYPNSLRGYVEYMGDAIGLDGAKNSPSFFFTRPRTLPIRESDRRQHS